MRTTGVLDSRIWGFRFFHASTVIFLFEEKDFSWTQVDCGIAVENMALAAQSLDVGSVILVLPRHAFTGSEGDSLRRSLKCPEGCGFVIAITLGYATDTKAVHDLNNDHSSRITVNEMIEGIEPFTSRVLPTGDFGCCGTTVDR